MSESQASEARPEEHPPDSGQDGRPGPFPIVDVGASAGGLEAFIHLLTHLPDNPGMGIVFVQHLDPKHSSTLADILARSTRLPVLEAEHGMAVRPNHVYVIPPNNTMSLSAGLLQLAPRGESRISHLPVDQFFRSLAEDRQTGAIGVILSGNGSDGPWAWKRSRRPEALPSPRMNRRPSLPACRTVRCATAASTSCCRPMPSLAS